MAQQTTLQAIWEAVIHPLWQEQYGSNRSLPELHTMDDYFYCYRKLVNVRPPAPMPDEWIAQQNKVLGAYNQPTTELAALTSIREFENGSQLYLWQGDITALVVDGIVNAANSQLEGCYLPGHNCIDNVIHSKAGIQLRQDCHELIQEQGRKEPVGRAKLTPAYNLPSNYVLHTVGPNVRGKQVGKMHRDLLANCYQQCLLLATEQSLTSLAFCCISTGEFGFPQQEAAEIAIQEVTTFLGKHTEPMQVVFNVFTDKDKEIYERLLTAKGDDSDDAK